MLQTIDLFFFLIIVPLICLGGYCAWGLVTTPRKRKKTPAEPLPKSAEYSRVVFCNNCKHFYKKQTEEITPLKKTTDTRYWCSKLDKSVWTANNENNCEFFESK